MTAAPAPAAPAPRRGWLPRLRAAGLHLLLSALVASGAAALVFGLWYPGAYREMSGGRELFLLITSVDVVLGPLLTLVAFNIAKPRAELRRDLAVIGLLQVSALAYGLHTTFVARPVALVFEVDRYRVVTEADVRLEELPRAPDGLRSLSLTGPRVIGARQPADGDERNEALFLGLQGYDVGQRPSFWEPYAESRARALGRSRPVSLLLDRQTTRRGELEQALAAAGLDREQARFLPVTARGDWVALMSADGEVRGFAPFDGFF